MKKKLTVRKFTLSFLLISALFITSCENKVKEALEIPVLNEVGAQAMPEKIAPIENIPFDMPQIQKPTFPDLIVAITEKGADSIAPITEIVNKTILEVSEKGGGTVVIPKGYWKSARIVLKSNVNLHIAEGATVEFSGEVEDYLPAVFTRHEGIEIMGAGAFIYANNENNIAITGKGKIQGPPMDVKMRSLPNGASVVEKDIPVEMPIEERLFDGMEGRYFYRPKTISPINCTNVFIEGVTVEQGVLWNIAPIYCENVIIRGVTVNSVNVPSGDGIDISSCKNVLIEYTTLNCGDDCFTLKSGRAEDGLRVGKPTENVVIRYSLAEHGHGGITCGSETAGGIKNVYVQDCVFNGTRSAIRFKTRRNRGGGTENFYCERIRMIDINEAFTWDLLGSPMYMGELAERTPPRAVNSLTPELKNIYLKDFIVESSNRFFKVNGIPEIPLKNVLIENGVVNCKVLINALDDVDGLTVKNVTVTAEKDSIFILDSRNILFENVTFNVPSNVVNVIIEGDKSQNIVFKNVGSESNTIEYTGTSPLQVKAN